MRKILVLPGIYFIFTTLRTLLVQIVPRIENYTNSTQKFLVVMQTRQELIFYTHLDLFYLTMIYKV